MQKKFITNLAFLLLLNFLIKPFWIFGIDRGVQNEVGAENYGLYAALFNFSFLFNILLDVGITNFNNRNIAQHNHLLQKHLSGILGLRLILAIIYFIVSFGFALLLGYEGASLQLLTMLLVNQALISFILYLRSNITGMHLFKIDSVVSVLDRFIMILVCGYLLWGGLFNTPFRIEWFVWAQTIAYAITTIMTMIFLSRKVDRLRISWNPLFAISILKKSYPYAILILLMTFYYRIDSVMIERLLPDGAEQAGIYAQALRLLDAANMLAYLFSVLLLPMFSQLIIQKKSPEDLVSLSFSFIAVPALIVMAFGVAYSDEIMETLYISHVKESAEILQLTINSFIAISSVYIFGTLMTANGNLKELNLIALSGMVLNIVLNLILIPEFMAKGAAIAGLITQFFTAGLQILLAHRIFRFKLRWKSLFRYLFFSLTAYSIFHFSHQIPADFIWQISVAFILCLLMSVILQLIQPKSLLVLLKNSEN